MEIPSSPDVTFGSKVCIPVLSSDLQSVIKQDEWRSAIMIIRRHAIRISRGQDSHCLKVAGEDRSGTNRQ